MNIDTFQKLKKIFTYIFLDFKVVINEFLVKKLWKS